MNGNVRLESSVSQAAVTDALATNPTVVFAAAGILVLAGCLAYLPTLEGRFLNYDDPDYVTENPHVAGGLSLSNIRWAFTTSHAANWHPLTWLSHQLDATLFGSKSPVGPHAVNLLLHLASGVTLLVFLLSATGRYWPSVMVAALFLLHPVNVETVAWVSQRKSLLSTFFFMLTLLAYLAYVRSSSARTFCVCLLLYACSLMAKPMMVTAPVLLLILDYWPCGRIGRRRREQVPTLAAAPPTTAVAHGQRVHGVRVVWEKAPFAVLAFLSCGMTLWAQQTAMADPAVFSWEVRASNALIAAATYLKMFVWPAHLLPIYLHPRSIPPAVELIAASATLIAVSVIVWAVRRQGYPVVGWLWYLAALVPTLGFVQVGLQSMADRYAYVPFIGLDILLAWSIADVVARSRSWQVAAVASIVAVVILGILTYRQTTFWRDSFKLFERVIAVDPENYVAHVHLADAYQKTGDLESAARHAQAAFESAYAVGYRNVKLPVHLATLWANTKRTAEARRLLEDVIDERPDYAPAYAHLAEIMLVTGDPARAEKLARTALDLDRQNKIAKKVLANLRGWSG